MRYLRRYLAERQGRRMSETRKKHLRYVIVRHQIELDTWEYTPEKRRLKQELIDRCKRELDELSP